MKWPLDGSATWSSILVQRFMTIHFCHSQKSLIFLVFGQEKEQKKRRGGGGGGGGAKTNKKKDEHIWRANVEGSHERSWMVKKKGSESQGHNFEFWFELSSLRAGGNWANSVSMWAWKVSPLFQFQSSKRGVSTLLSNLSLWNVPQQ